MGIAAKAAVGSFGRINQEVNKLNYWQIKEGRKNESTMEKKKHYRLVLKDESFPESVADDAETPYIAYFTACKALRDCGYVSYHLEFEILNWLEKMAMAKEALELEKEPEKLDEQQIMAV